MTYTFIARMCPDLPVAICCRVMKVSTSGYYGWQADPVSEKDLDDAHLTDTIVDIWHMSRRSMALPGCTPSCAWAGACAARESGWSGSWPRPA